MKIALAQIDTTVGSLEGNSNKIRDYTCQARGGGAELVIFPEMCLTGYPPRDLLEKKQFLDDTNKTYNTLVQKLPDDIGVIIGLPVTIKNNSLPMNSARLSYGARILHEYHKVLLPVYDVFDECRYFDPGERSQSSAEFLDKNISITICEDLLYRIEENSRYDFDPVETILGNNSDTIINISASPFVIGKPLCRYNCLSNIAKKTNRPLIYLNSIGGNDELIFDGSSFVLNNEGKCIKQLQPFKEELAFIELQNKDVPGFGPEFPDEEESILAALVIGLKDYCEKLRFKTCVIGLSGGIDSSLVAAIATKSLGADNVLGVAMPSKYSSSSSIEDAKKLAENLGIRFEIISIQPLFDSYLNTLENIFKGLPQDVTEENIQARIRGNILMALSNKFGSLLLSTGNKSELAVGYCTLYGDMSGGLSVISDVPKTTVYRLAEFLNSNKEVIPRNVLIKPPSAELKPNQKDQDSLPPYDILDKILFEYIENKKGLNEILKMGFDIETVKKVIKLVNRNEYKRKQAAIGLKVTSKAFGQGRRYPIVQRYD